MPNDDEEDDAVIAGIKFGGERIRRLSDDEGESFAPGKASASAQDARQRVSSDGKALLSETSSLSQKRPPSTRDGEEGKQYTFPGGHEGGGQSTSLAGGGQTKSPGEGSGVVASSGLQGGDRDRDRGPGSLLVAGIESQVRRAAEKAVAATGGSSSTTIVVKGRKRGNKESVEEVGGRSGGSGKLGKKRRKPSSKRKMGEGNSKDGGVGGVGGAGGDAGEDKIKPRDGGELLGGLLGAYNSSGSDDAD